MHLTNIFTHFQQDGATDSSCSEFRAKDLESLVTMIGWPINFEKVPRYAHDRQSDPVDRVTLTYDL